MNLRHWEIAWAVLSTGSVTRAAEVLRISQPSVSQALRHTEDQLGFALFNRVHGRLTPTFEATLLLPEMEQMFGHAERMDQLARDLRHSREGLVHVATIATLAAAVLPSAIASLRERHPDVRVKLSVLATSEVVRLTAGHLVDFGLIHTEASDSGLEVEDVMRSQMICIMRSDHPLAKRTVVSPRDLQGQTLIAARDSVEPLISSAFRQAGDVLDMAIEVNHSLTASRLVELGLGVALVDPFVLRPAGSVLVSRRFAPAIPLETRILYSKERPLSRYALDFVDIVRTAARKFQDLAGLSGIPLSAEGTPGMIP